MHVALKPGDQLRFGESTRIYLFQTEEEVDQEEEERKLVNAMIERQNRPKTQQQQRQQRDDEDEGEFNWYVAYMPYLSLPFISLSLRRFACVDSLIRIKI